MTQELIESVIIKGKVIRVIFPENIYLDLEQVMRIVKKSERYSYGKPFCFLADCRKSEVRFSPSSRKFLASGAVPGRRIADAVMVSTLTDKLIGDIYNRVHQPSVPTQFFTSEESAKKWLEKMITLKSFQLN